MADSVACVHHQTAGSTVGVGGEDRLVGDEEAGGAQ